jgi:hypothetical protein
VIYGGTVDPRSIDPQSAGMRAHATFGEIVTRCASDIG